ncbi:MAG: hypothetical protein HYV27_01145 [Candidatus Hydrogenedentes bacterium]|nr:hypothetical protein [Candidatus Hydrogenedentota bacterium]
MTGGDSPDFHDVSTWEPSNKQWHGYLEVSPVDPWTVDSSISFSEGLLFDESTGMLDDFVAIGFVERSRKQESLLCDCNETGDFERDPLAIPARRSARRQSGCAAPPRMIYFRRQTVCRPISDSPRLNGDFFYRPYGAAHRGMGP